MPESVEKQVQDFVVGVDNLGPKVFRIVLWLSAAVVLFFLSFSIITSSPIRLINIDAIDYAQVAKNFSRGEGLTTKFIRPVSFHFFPTFEKHPEVTNPPLYSVYLGTILKLIDAPLVMKGEIDRKIILFGSGLFFILSVPLFIWLARRLVSRNVAYMGLFFYITNIIVLRESVSALPDMFLAFLFLLFLIALSYYDGDNMFKPVIIGVTLGLCYLTRYTYGLFAIPLCGYIFLKARKFKVLHLVLFVLAFLGVISPWLVRNYNLTGNPFFTLEWFKYKMFIEALPGNLYWRSFIDSVFATKLNLFFLIRKFGMGLHDYYGQMLQLLGTFLTPFFIVAFFYTGIRNRQNKLKWLILLFLVIQIIVASLFRPGANGIFPFFPFVILVAVDLFLELLDRKSINPFVRLGVVSVFIVINVVPTVQGFMPKLFSEDMYRPPKMYAEDNLQEVAVSVKPDTVIISDIPWATAWYGNITSIWLPWGGDDYANITKKVGQIDGCYFSTMVLRYPQSKEKLWIKFYSYVFRYKKVPSNNKFGWDSHKTFRNGDVFCCFRSKLKQE